MDDGMVVTVEPGIYVNGLGGVRIEDMIVINGDHPDVLTASKKDMIVCRAIKLYFTIKRNLS